MKTHGGFRTGDQVDVRLGKGGRWLRDRWIVLDFDLLRVQVQHADRRGNPFWISVFHIRKPNIRI